MTSHNTEYDPIRHKLTPEFLATLNECAKIFGWSGDYHEVHAFVVQINEEGGVDSSTLDLDPY